jgi:hypothetical protein
MRDGPVRLQRWDGVLAARAHAALLRPSTTEASVGGLNLEEAVSMDRSTTRNVPNPNPEPEPEPMPPQPGPPPTPQPGPSRRRLAG